MWTVHMRTARPPIQIPPRRLGAYPAVMRVLVVEDEARMARLLKRGLEEEGHSVDVGVDGPLLRALGDRVQPLHRVGGVVACEFGAVRGLLEATRKLLAGAKA